MEVRQRPSIHVVIAGSDGKPKPLSYTRLAGVNELEISLGTKQKFFEEKFVLILKKILIIMQNDCSCHFVVQLVSSEYLMN